MQSCALALSVMVWRSCSAIIIQADLSQALAPGLVHLFMLLRRAVQSAIVTGGSPVWQGSAAAGLRGPDLLTAVLPSWGFLL